MGRGDPIRALLGHEDRQRVGLSGGALPTLVCLVGDLLEFKPGT